MCIRDRGNKGKSNSDSISCELPFDVFLHVKKFNSD